MKWIKLTWARLKSKSPVYFEKIYKFSLKMIIVCTAVLGAQAVNFIDIPEVFWRTVSYILVAFIAIAAMAKSTTDKKQLSEQS